MASSWKKKLKITSSSQENWVLFFSKEIFVKQRKGGISCTPQPFLIVIYLQLSTKKTKKSVKSLFVHFLIRLANSSNVMAWWCWCQMMMTMKWKICVFWQAQQLGMKLISCRIWVWKWVLSFVTTTCIFLSLCFQSHSMYGANTRFQSHVWITLQKTLLSRGFLSYH